MGWKAACAQPIQDTLFMPLSSRRTSLKSNQRSAQLAQPAHYYSSDHTKQRPLRVSNNTSSLFLFSTEKGFGLRQNQCGAERPLTHTGSILSGRAVVCLTHSFALLKTVAGSGLVIRKHHVSKPRLPTIRPSKILIIHCALDQMLAFTQSPSLLFVLLRFALRHKPLVAQV